MAVYIPREPDLPVYRCKPADLMTTLRCRVWWWPRRAPGVMFGAMPDGSHRLARMPRWPGNLGMLSLVSRKCAKQRGTGDDHPGDAQRPTLVKVEWSRPDASLPWPNLR